MEKSNREKRRPELLAPAGDMERLRAAIRFGADAVYLAGEGFGMRSACPNFSPEELEKAVRFAHERDVRVYLACNTLPHHDDMKQLPSFLRHAAHCGVDALIVADLGVLETARRTVPQIPLHASTQVGVVNFAAANALYHMGVSRVVLARELSLAEIAQLRAETDPGLSIECFVHGAMCMSFSGRCMLSRYLTGRDANRGDCAQPCRWRYALMEEKRPGQYFPIEETESGTYLLNARDLCLIDHLPALLKAGVTSFKIEGRAKSAYYTAVTTNAYRCAIDGYLKSRSSSYHPSRWIIEELERVSHRPYCTGFYFDAPEQNAQIYEKSGYIRTWDVVAVAARGDGTYLYATQRNRFFEGDTLELLEPGSPPCRIRVQGLETEEGERIGSAPHPMMPLRFFYSRPVAEGALLRRCNEESKVTAE